MKELESIISEAGEKKADVENIMAGIPEEGLDRTGIREVSSRLTAVERNVNTLNRRNIVLGKDIDGIGEGLSRIKGTEWAEHDSFKEAEEKLAGARERNNTADERIKEVLDMIRNARVTRLADELSRMEEKEKAAETDRMTPEIIRAEEQEEPEVSEGPVEPETTEEPEEPAEPAAEGPGEPGEPVDLEGAEEPGEPETPEQKYERETKEAEEIIKKLRAMAAPINGWLKNTGVDFMTKEAEETIEKDKETFLPRLRFLEAWVFFDTKKATKYPLTNLVRSVVMVALMGAALIAPNVAGLINVFPYVAVAVIMWLSLMGRKEKVGYGSLFAGIFFFAQILLPIIPGVTVGAVSLGLLAGTLFLYSAVPVIKYLLAISGTDMHGNEQPYNYLRNQVEHLKEADRILKDIHEKIQDNPKLRDWTWDDERPIRSRDIRPRDEASQETVDGRYFEGGITGKTRAFGDVIYEAREELREFIEAGEGELETRRPVDVVSKVLVVTAIFGLAVTGVVMWSLGLLALTPAAIFVASAGVLATLITSAVISRSILSRKLLIDIPANMKCLNRSSSGAMLRQVFRARPDADGKLGKALKVWDIWRHLTQLAANKSVSVLEGKTREEVNKKFARGMEDLADSAIARGDKDSMGLTKAEGILPKLKMIGSTLLFLTIVMGIAYVVSIGLFAGAAWIYNFLAFGNQLTWLELFRHPFAMVKIAQNLPWLTVLAKTALFAGPGVLVMLLGGHLKSEAFSRISKNVGLVGVLAGAIAGISQVMAIIPFATVSMAVAQFVVGSIIFGSLWIFALKFLAYYIGVYTKLYKEEKKVSAWDVVKNAGAAVISMGLLVGIPRMTGVATGQLLSQVLNSAFWGASLGMAFSVVLVFAAAYFAVKAAAMLIARHRYKSIAVGDKIDTSLDTDKQEKAADSFQGTFLGGNRYTHEELDVLVKANQVGKDGLSQRQRMMYESMMGHGDIPSGTDYKSAAINERYEQLTESEIVRLMSRDALAKLESEDMIPDAMTAAQLREFLGREGNYREQLLVRVKLAYDILTVEQLLGRLSGVGFSNLKEELGLPADLKLWDVQAAPRSFKLRVIDKMEDGRFDELKAKYGLPADLEKKEMLENPDLLDGGSIDRMVADLAREAIDSDPLEKRMILTYDFMPKVQAWMVIIGADWEEQIRPLVQSLLEIRYPLKKTKFIFAGETWDDKTEKSVRDARINAKKKLMGHMDEEMKGSLPEQFTFEGAPVREENALSARGRGLLPRSTRGFLTRVFGPQREPSQAYTKPFANTSVLKDSDGAYGVIYDAEDKPESEQILKFVLGLTDGISETRRLKRSFMTKYITEEPVRSHKPDDNATKEKKIAYYRRTVESAVETYNYGSYPAWMRMPDRTPVQIRPLLRMLTRPVLSVLHAFGYGGETPGLSFEDRIACNRYNLKRGAVLKRHMNWFASETLPTLLEIIHNKRLDLLSVSILWQRIKSERDPKARKKLADLYRCISNISGYGRLATDFLNSDGKKEAEAAFIEGVIFGEFERINAPKNGQGRLSQSRSGALALPWRNGAFFEGEYGAWYNFGWDAFHALPDTFKPLGGTTGWFCTEPVEEICWDEVDWTRVKSKLPEGFEFDETKAKAVMEEEYAAKKKLTTIGAWDEMQVAEDYMLGFLGWLYGFNIASFYTLTPEDATSTTGITMNTRTLQTSRWNKGYIIGLVVLATNPSVLREVWKRKGLLGMLTFLVSTLSSAIHPLLFRMARMLTIFWCFYFLPAAGAVWVLLKVVPGWFLSIENETNLTGALSGFKEWIGDVVPQVFNPIPMGWGWLVGPAIVIIPILLHKFFTMLSMFMGINKKLNLKRQEQEISDEYIEGTQKKGVREIMGIVNAGSLGAIIGKPVNDAIKTIVKEMKTATTPQEKEDAEKAAKEFFRACALDAQTKMAQLLDEERVMLELWGRVKKTLKDLPVEMSREEAARSVLAKLGKNREDESKDDRTKERDRENFKLLWNYVERKEDGTYFIPENVNLGSITLDAMVNVWKKVKAGGELTRDEEETHELLKLFLSDDADEMYRNLSREKLLSFLPEEIRAAEKAAHRRHIYMALDRDDNLVHQLHIRMYLKVSQGRYLTMRLFEMYMNLPGRHAEITDEAEIKAMAEFWQWLDDMVRNTAAMLPELGERKILENLVNQLDPTNRALYGKLEPFLGARANEAYEDLSSGFILANVSEDVRDSLEYYTEEEIRARVETVDDGNLPYLLSREGRKILGHATPAEIRDFVRTHAAEELRANLVESATHRTLAEIKDILGNNPEEQLRVRIAAVAKNHNGAIVARQVYRGHLYENIRDGVRRHLKTSLRWEEVQDIKERTVDEFKLMGKAIREGDLTVEGLIGKPRQTFVTGIIGFFFPEMKTVTLSLIAPKLWLFWAGTIVASVLSLVFLPSMHVLALIPVWLAISFAGGLLTTFVVMAVVHRYITSAHGEERAMRALSIRLAMPNLFIDCYQTLYLYGNKVAWNEVISGSRLAFWWLTGRAVNVLDTILEKNANAFYPEKFKIKEDDLTQKRLKLQTIWNWGFMVALYHIVAVGLRGDLADSLFSSIAETIASWSSIAQNSPVANYVAAALVFAAAVAGIVLLVRKAVKKAGDWKEPEFVVTLGLPADIYDELMDKNVDMEKLGQRTGVDNFVRIEAGDEDGRVKELQEKTRGEKAVLALLDHNELPYDPDTFDINFTELEKIMKNFAQRAVNDIMELMHPEISKLDGETLVRINNVDSLRNIAHIMARVLPEGECLDLGEKSIYEIRIDNIYNMHRANYSERALRYLEGLERPEQAQMNRRYFVTAVDKAMDLRLLANSIRERREAMEVTDPAADPVRDIVIVRNEIVAQDVEAVLEETGLGKYITADSVIVIGEGETLNTGGVIAKIAEKTGEEVTANQVVMGTKTGIIQVDEENPGEILRADKEDSALLVQLEGGLVSQLYKMMVEITANGDRKVTGADKELTQVSGYNVYIYLPRMEKMDLEAEIANYERYISEILVRA